MRRKSLSAEPIDLLKEIAAGESPHMQVVRWEQEELIRRAVTALPPRYRDAVIVYYFREMDLAETAAILGVPEGSAKAGAIQGGTAMNPDTLDQISLSDRYMAAPATFSGIVMARIQLEAALARSAPFPWIRFASILLVVSIPIVWFFPYDLAVRSMNSLANSIGQTVPFPIIWSCRKAC
jgi:hypothetical protein